MFLVCLLLLASPLLLLVRDVLVDSAAAVLYYYGASKVFNLSTIRGKIRQSLNTKMRQLF
jgi:hypothetical protein